MLKHIYLLSSLIIFGSAYGQFGFDRTLEIDVIKSGVAQEFPWAGGMDYCQFSNIDLNFDGVEDLFVFDRTCNKVMTFIQNGGPGESDFSYEPEYELQFPDDLINWTLLADYNCDGKMDVFTNTIGGVKVYKNIGNAEDGNVFELESPILQTTVHGGLTYLFVSSPDIPAIVDIDGDGDLDILGFGVLGRAVEYHKNLSMELYGDCGTLEYETKNLCWGRFREDGETNEVSLWDTTEYPCRHTDLDGIEEFTRPLDSEDRHTGSTVLALDMENTGVMDLVLGDASYNNLVLLLNSGTTVNSNSGMDDQDGAFPSTSVSVDLPIFPGAYHVDVDNDNIRDLLVSPNSKIGSQNINSVWRYLNEGADLEPDFVYQEDNFLQSEMIEQGTSSLPVFFDHNGDGIKDLLVSSRGQYNPLTDNLISKIAYYENTGTDEIPVFEYITDDYQDISEMGIGSSLVFYPTFGDLDGDGDEDMILGEYTGYCYYMENTGGAGNPAIFNTYTTLLDNEDELIFAGSTFTYPKLVDLDRDGDYDLTIGRRIGTIDYYENIGTTSFDFEFVTDSLGYVDVSVGAPEGHAVPEFVDVDGEYQLLVGSKGGELFYFDDIEGNLDGTFHLVEVNVDNIDIGTYTAPTVTNLNGNSRLEMVLGNRRGGVALFESAPTSDIGLAELDNHNDILIYPNPTNDQFTVVLGSLTASQLKQTDIAIYNMTGSLLQRIKPQMNVITIDVSDYAKGTYLIEVIDGQQSLMKKLIVN